MKKGSKPVRILMTREEGVDFVKDGVASIVKNLPDANDPTKFIVSVGIDFLTARITSWSKEIKDFISSDKSKKEVDLPYRKLTDTMKFLKDTSLSDDRLLEALKNLHILSFSVDTTDSEEAETYMMLELVRKLKGEEVLTLLTAYKIGNNLYSEEQMSKITEGYQYPTSTHSGAWCRMITRALGYSTDDLISMQQEHLEVLGLISERNLDVRFSGKKVADYPPGKCFRLTELGVRLVELINKGQKLSEEKLES